MIENKHAEPLKPTAGSPSQNSRQKAATEIQSDVKPEDYTAEERSMEAAQATDGTPGGRKK